MRFHRLSIFAILAAFFPVYLWADDSGAGGGGNPPASDPAKTPPLSQADIDKAVQAARTQAAADFAAQFEKATGHKSFEAFQEAQAKAKGEESKLLEQRTQELTQTRAELAQANISTAILGAAGEAIDPATVLALLSGKAKYENGGVTIDGRPPAEAVKALLAEKPFLAKPAGKPGSGTPQNAGPGTEKNPWHPDTFNLTEQGRIEQADPAKAAQLKAAAGVA